MDRSIPLKGKWIARCPKMHAKGGTVTCKEPKEKSFQWYLTNGQRVGPHCCEKHQNEKEKNWSKGTSKTYYHKKRAAAERAAGGGKTQGAGVTLSDSMGAMSMTRTTAPTFSGTGSRPSGPEPPAARSSTYFDTALQSQPSAGTIQRRAPSPDEEESDRSETRSERGRRYAEQQGGRPSPSPSPSPSPPPKKRKGDKSHGKKK